MGKRDFQKGVSVHNLPGKRGKGQRLAWLCVEKSKTQIRKKWPLLASGFVAKGRRQSWAVYQETAPGGIPYLREFVMAPSSAPREQLHLPGVVLRNSSSQDKGRNGTACGLFPEGNLMVMWNGILALV